MNYILEFTPKLDSPLSTSSSTFKIKLKEKNYESHVFQIRESCLHLGEISFNITEFTSPSDSNNEPLSLNILS